MTTLDRDTLAAVSGGMKWQEFRRSTNVEDRRGLTPWQSMHARTQPAAPLPPLTRSPNDLSHQAGLDDLELPR